MVLYQNNHDCFTDGEPKDSGFCNIGFISLQARALNDSGVGDFRLLSCCVSETMQGIIAIDRLSALDYGTVYHYINEILGSGGH